MKRIGAVADAPASGRLNLFGVGLDDAVYHKAWNGSAWDPPAGGWERIGGTALSHPAAVSWGPGRLDVFVVGPTRQLAHKWRETGWAPSQLDWEPLGGYLTSPPAVASWGPGRLDVVALGIDRQLYHKWFEGRWGPSPLDWTGMGGRFISSPAIVSSEPGRLAIFGLGLDRHLYTKRWDGSAWRPSPLEWDLLGGPFRSMPAAVSWGPGRVDVFGVGDDGRMLHKAWDNGRWSPPVNYWESLGGSFSSRPAVASWEAQRLDVFAVGGNAEMYHKWWDGSWGPGMLEWEPQRGIFISSPEAVAWGTGRVDVFGLGLDAQMFHRYFQGTWGPSGGWEPLGGIFRMPPPVTVSPASTESRWAILLCKFRDDASEPIAREHYWRLFTAAGCGTGNIVDFYHDATGDRVDLSRSVVHGWLTLDRNRSDYMGSGTNWPAREQLVTWAREAAARAGIDLSPYAGVVVTLNVATDLWGGGGRVVCDLNSLQASILSHEMGHGLGLSHSRIDGSTEDYRDPWDIMSADATASASSVDYGKIGPGLNAANMRSRGWLDANAVWRPPAGPTDATVTIVPLHLRDRPELRAVELPGDFIAELRVAERWDAVIREATVLVHRFDANHSYLMRSTSGDTQMRVGARFEATVNGSTMRMTVVDIAPSARSATVRVQHPAP